MLGILVALNACNSESRNSAQQTIVAAVNGTVIITKTPEVTPYLKSAPTEISDIQYRDPTETQPATPTKIVNSKTPTASPTNKPTATDTPTPTLTATYAILRGKVIPDKANCRYGPGAPYLYKYGLVGGSNLEVIGRNDQGSWLLIQAIGGSNPCWAKTELMEINGDEMGVEPLNPEIIQAWSPYYPPITNVSAVRNEEMVTVFWTPLILRPGDDSEQVPYVVEAWVCQDENLIFIPVGSYGTTAQIRDETECTEQSHGRVLAAEKHGYTSPVEIIWPTSNP